MLPTAKDKIADTPGPVRAAGETPSEPDV